jgi:hypothetical protein
MERLVRAAERLQRMEQLLVCATPAAIGESETLLAEVSVLIAEHREELKRRPAEQREKEMAGRLQLGCERVMKLLEGARRGHWLRLRLITCLTQTYTARAEVKMWSAGGQSINVRA